MRAEADLGRTHSAVGRGGRWGGGMLDEGLMTSYCVPEHASVGRFFVFVFFLFFSHMALLLFTVNKYIP